MNSNKPRILIFSLAYTPFIGGAEIAIQEITKRLDGNFSFDLITCNLDGKQKSQEQIGNVKVYRVESKFFYPWQAFKKSKELQKENNYNLVWGMMAFWAGWVALKFKEKFPQVKYLLTLQSGDSNRFIKTRTWFWSWRYKKIYKKADRIQVISSWLAQRAIKFGYKGRIDVVPNGVAINSKQGAINNKQGEIILTVSRLAKKNDIESLIKSISNLENVVLKIIGEGPERNNLENLVKKLKLENRVKFLGKIKYEDLGKYYSQADVFCRPSLSEGFGNVFIEAMASEVPVVATKVGGIPDFLKDGETGWFCEVKNPQSIAEKIKYILDKKNEQEVQKVVTNAKKMVKEKYTWEIVSKKMKNIFKELIK